MFENAQKGDRVWSMAEGWGTVSIDEHATYPIDVDFDSGDEESFTREGMEHVEDEFPTLFWQAVPVPDECKIRPEKIIIIRGKEYSEDTIHTALKEYIND